MDTAVEAALLLGFEKCSLTVSVGLRELRLLRHSADIIREQKAKP
jgi:hypothetical protein